MRYTSVGLTETVLQTPSTSLPAVGRGLQAAHSRAANRQSRNSERLAGAVGCPLGRRVTAGRQERGMWRRGVLWRGGAGPDLRGWLGARARVSGGRGVQA